MQIDEKEDKCKLRKRKLTQSDEEFIADKQDLKKYKLVIIKFLLLRKSLKMVTSILSNPKFYSPVH